VLKAFSFFFNLWDGFSDVLLNTVHSNSWFVRNHVDKACGRLKKKYSCCNFTVKSKLNTGRGIDRTRIRNGVNMIGRIQDSLRPKTKSTDDIILQLQKCFLKELGPDQAQKLLKSADCSLFEEKAEFDDFGYKRILIEENEKFNLVLMCWPEGSATSIHDHTGSECIMKCLAGKIRETRYKWPVKKRQSLEKIWGCT